MHDDVYDKDKTWTGSTAARRFTVWIILWILIDLAIITWIFAFAHGEEGTSSMELFTAGGIISAYGVNSD